MPWPLKRWLEALKTLTTDFANRLLVLCQTLSLLSVDFKLCANGISSKWVLCWERCSIVCQMHAFFVPWWEGSENWEWWLCTCFRPSLVSAVGGWYGVVQSRTSTAVTHCSGILLNLLHANSHPVFTLVENSCIELPEHRWSNLDPSQSIPEKEAAEIKSTFTAGLCPIAAIASGWDSQKAISLIEWKLQNIIHWYPRAVYAKFPSHVFQASTFMPPHLFGSDEEVKPQVKL